MAYQRGCTSVVCARSCSACTRSFSIRRVRGGSGCVCGGGRTLAHRQRGPPCEEHNGGGNTLQHGWRCAVAHGMPLGPPSALKPAPGHGRRAGFSSCPQPRQRGRASAALAAYTCAAVFESITKKKKIPACMVLSRKNEHNATHSCTRRGFPLDMPPTWCIVPVRTFVGPVPAPVQLLLAWKSPA